MQRLETLNKQFDQKKLLLINGEWRDSLSKKSFECVNPATEKVICQVAAGQKEDVDLAVEAATNALKTWS